MPERLAVSVSEAAEMLGVGQATLYQYVRAGLIPHVRIGRRIVIPLKALEEWMEQKAQEAWRSYDDPKTWPIEDALAGPPRSKTEA